MKIKNLFDKDYLLEVSQDLEKLKEASKKDAGLLFEAFKEHGIYPPVEFIKEIHTVEAQVFLIDNYELEEKEKKALAYDKYTHNLFIDMSSAFAQKHNLKDINSLEDGGYIDIDLPISKVSVEVSNKFPQQAKKLKKLEFLINFKSINEDFSLSISNELKKLANEIFNHCSEDELSETLKHKKNRDLLNIVDISISTNVILHFWRYELDLSILNKWAIDNNQSQEVKEVLSFLKNNHNLTVNDIFANVLLDMKHILALNDEFNDFSSKSWDSLFDDVNLLNFYAGGDGKNLPEHVKGSQLKLFNSLSTALSKIKNNNSNLPSLTNDLNLLIKQLEKNPYETKRVVGALQDKVLDFAYKEIAFNGDKDYYDTVNRFYDVLVSNIFQIGGIMESYFDTPLPERALSIEPNTLSKFYMMGGFDLTHLNDSKSSLSKLFKKMTKENPALINDYLSLLDGKKISLSSPVFKDPWFQAKNGGLSYHAINYLNLDLVDELLKSHKVGDFNFNFNFNVSQIKILSTKEIIPLEAKILLSKESKSLLTLNEQRWLDKYRVYGKNKDLVGAKDVDLKFAVKDFIQKWNKFDELNTASVYHIEYEKGFISDENSRLYFEKQIANTNVFALFENKKENEILSLFNELIKNGEVDIKKDLKKLNALWAMQCNNEKFFDFYIFQSIKNKEELNIDTTDYINFLNSDFLRENKFHLTDEEKSFVFKKVFSNDMPLLKKNAHKKISNFQLSNSGLNLKDTINYLMKNAPTVLLSGEYSFAEMYPNDNQFTFTNLYETFFNARENYGVHWKKGQPERHYSLISRFMAKVSEEEYLNVLEKAKSEFPAFYTFITCPSIIKKASATNDYFRDLLLKRKEAFPAEEFPENGVAWSFIDSKTLTDGYKEIIKSYAHNRLLENFVIGSLSTNNIFRNDFEHLSAVSKNDTLYVEKEKLEDVLVKLIQEDLGLFNVILEIENLSKIIEIEPFYKKIIERVETVDDVFKLMFGLCSEDSMEMDTKKGTAEIYKITHTNYHLEEGLYIGLLNKFFENPEILNVIDKICDKVDFHYENMFPSSHSSFNNTLWARSSEFKAVIENLQERNIDFPALCKAKIKKDALDKSMDNVFFHEEDNDSIQFKI